MKRLVIIILIIMLRPLTGASEAELEFVEIKPVTKERAGDIVRRRREALEKVWNCPTFKSFWDCYYNDIDRFDIFDPYNFTNTFLIKNDGTCRVYEAEGVLVVLVRDEYNPNYYWVSCFEDRPLNHNYGDVISSDSDPVGKALKKLWSQFPERSIALNRYKGGNSDDRVWQMRGFLSVFEKHHKDHEHFVQKHFERLKNRGRISPEQKIFQDSVMKVWVHPGVSKPV